MKILVEKDGRAAAAGAETGRISFAVLKICAKSKTAAKPMRTEDDRTEV